MSNNDWLKYNASEYQVGDKVYRNLEAQVLKNMEDIEAMDVSGLQEDVAQLQEDVAGKQDELTAGSNITITDEGVISAENTTYSAGSGISISAANQISATAVGLPSGGTTGQVLKKTTNSDFACEWENESGGGGSDKIEVYSFSSGFVAHRSGLPANASLPVGVTAEDIYDAYTAGKAVVLIDSAGIVAFVVNATESSGVYTVNVRGYGSYHDTLDPVIPYQFYGRVNSESQTFTVTHFFDVQTRRNTATIVIAAADWQSAGGGEFYDCHKACSGMTSTAAVYASAIPSQMYTAADYGIIATNQYTDYIDFRTKGTDIV